MIKRVFLLIVLALATLIGNVKLSGARGNMPTNLNPVVPSANASGASSITSTLMPQGISQANRVANPLASNTANNQPNKPSKRNLRILSEVQTSLVLLI